MTCRPCLLVGALLFAGCDQNSALQKQWQVVRVETASDTGSLAGLANGVRISFEDRALLLSSGKSRARFEAEIEPTDDGDATIRLSRSGKMTTLRLKSVSSNEARLTWSGEGDRFVAVLKETKP